MIKKLVNKMFEKKDSVKPVEEINTEIIEEGKKWGFSAIEATVEKIKKNDLGFSISFSTKKNRLFHHRRHREH